MQTIDVITIQAAPDAIFRAAAEIERWPAILPHYRKVTILASHGTRRWVTMAARRGWLPVQWTSEQWIDESTLRVYYIHTGGITKGMAVLWLIEPYKEAVRVSIVHDLALQYPLIRSWLGQWIVGHWFVKPVAQKTLHYIKRYLEDFTCSEPLSPDSDQ